MVAGAGTGKTAVITSRVAYLIREKKLNPDAILALTFTDKAAGEMLDRLDALIGWQAYQVNVMTFHAFGSQLLQRFGHHAGLPTAVNLLSSTEKLLLLKKHLKEVKLEYYGPHPDVLDFIAGTIAFIENLQNADITPEKLESYISEMEKGGAHRLDIAEARDRLKLYRLYEKVKRSSGSMDFHDQIALSLRLLEEKPNVAESLTRQFKHVLVDEYQDTNQAQDKLLRTFIPENGNIFAVGDDDQAIYGFRGAKIGNILEFTDHFKVKEPFVLTENYRSTQGILDASYRLIVNNNPDRLEFKLGINKQLKARLPGEYPKFKGYHDSQAELQGVADEVSALIASGGRPPDIAVLAPGHASLRSMSKVLRTRGIPFYLTSSINIFEQPEILQLWHLLRWVGLEADDETVTQLLLGPLLRWSSAKVRLTVEKSRSDLISMEAALEKLADNEDAAKSLLDKLETWRGWAKSVPVSQLIYKLVFETGLSERWISESGRSARMVRVFEDLQLWLRQALAYENVSSDPALGSYLQDFPSPPQIESDEVTGDTDGVALLTIHSSKGLEFDTVFIINNSLESWTERPAFGQAQLPPGLEEDEGLSPQHEKRRLLYVAMTRARQNLWLTAPTRRSDGQPRKPSPFLPEIFDKKILETQPISPEKDRLQGSLQKLQQFAPSVMRWVPQRLPFETLEGWLELSVTDLDKYRRCPYEFYLEKVLKIISPIGPQIQFGSVLHGLFNDYYVSLRAGGPLDIGELLRRLEERWSNRGYQSLEEAAFDLERARQTLRAFYEREQAARRRVRSSEESFRLVIEEAKLKVRGKIDVSFEVDDGIEIRDFKTGRKRDAAKLSAEAKDNLQLRTYALAIEDMTGKPPARVVLDYIVTGVEGSAKLTPLVLSNQREKLIKLAEGIRKRQFEPTKDKNHYCAATSYFGIGEADE